MYVSAFIPAHLYCCDEQMAVTYLGSVLYLLK